MTVERLHFGHGAEPLNAMDAAEHFVRYAAAKGLAPGRRVLDIACGEGYGSWLLREWGASEVVGVDVSDEAIAAANTQFAREGVRFLLSDASRVCDLLGEERFDLIVCFETIEHVPDPASLLRAIRLLASPEAIILVSCPNDHVATEPGESNPFHLRKYTFAEFKSLAESCLDPAQAWLLGANAQGFALIQEGYALAEQIWTDPAAFLKSEMLHAAYVLPSQVNIRPAIDTVLFYMGVWGTTDIAPLAAVSMQSYAAFIESWRAIEWFRAQLAEADVRLADTKTQLDGALEQLAGVNERLAEKEAQLAKLHTEHEIACSKAGDLQRELAEADVRLADTKTQLDGALAQLAGVNERLAEKEAQLAKLNTEHEFACSKAGDLQREVDRLRRRLFALNDIVAALGTEQSRWHEAQARADEAIRLRDEKEAELQRILASRGRRLLDALYYRLYRIPYLGGLMNSIRRVVGKGLRWIRGR